MPSFPTTASGDAAARGPRLQQRNHEQHRTCSCDCLEFCHSTGQRRQSDVVSAAVTATAGDKSTKEQPSDHVRSIFNRRIRSRLDRQIEYHLFPTVGFGSGEGDLCEVVQIRVRVKCRCLSTRKLFSRGACAEDRHGRQADRRCWGHGGDLKDREGCTFPRLRTCLRRPSEALWEGQCHMPFSRKMMI